MAFKFLLQALQLWAVCEAISQYGDGYRNGPGMKDSILLYLIPLFFCFFLQVCPKLIFLNIVSCISKHQDAGMDWIIHLDTDELLHPADAREYSLRQLLLDVPGNVDMVIFPNYVSEIFRFVIMIC